MPVRLLKGIFFHLLFYVVRTCLGQKNYLAERCKSKCLKHFVNASPMWHEKWHLSKVNASCLARPGISKRIFYVNLLFLLSICGYYLSIYEILFGARSYSHFMYTALKLINGYENEYWFTNFVLPVFYK